MIRKECVYCNKIFETNSSRKRYCSHRCNNSNLKKKSRQRNFKHLVIGDRKNGKGKFRQPHTKGVIITSNNIDLYCKLSKIIRGKSCNKNLVFSKQKNRLNRITLP